jgi:hypothetical protein
MTSSWAPNPDFVHVHKEHIHSSLRTLIEYENEFDGNKLQEVLMNHFFLQRISRHRMNITKAEIYYLFN